jgi:hypothetical protein
MSFMERAVERGKGCGDGFGDGSPQLFAAFSRADVIARAGGAAADQGSAGVADGGFGVALAPVYA